VPLHAAQCPPFLRSPGLSSTRSAYPRPTCAPHGPEDTNCLGWPCAGWLCCLCCACCTVQCWTSWLAHPRAFETAATLPEILTAAGSVVRSTWMCAPLSRSNSLIVFPRWPIIAPTCHVSHGIEAKLPPLAAAAAGEDPPSETDSRHSRPTQLTRISVGHATLDTVDARKLNSLAYG
jgi:hypothetical protein